jgi:hypothetical protein
VFIWKPDWPAERYGLVRRSHSIVIHIVKISVQFNMPFPGSRRHLESIVFAIVRAPLANLPIGNY